ncbi:helix-turn-helix domain-containing protein [Rhizobium sp. TRM96647]|uniref:helix-turn-helix domain-containing protein n=1 Tax=unclassified Rhizobium TaxID=2613769 RepID=UPI0021E6DB55|nr:MULTISPECIES: helix-turn-helix domain-containing protein [unclassified Rhizobium]MCV3734994.1 helix-turn-helix domain-containing protein [Rhizobium sp. TRM96647]MCV3757364.1 helix-turn-helix domain-containing protein [Rhizobium sp. TRM96650]
MKPVSVTVDDATQYCGIGRTKLYELIRDGHFTARKAGKRTLLLTEELDAYVRSLPTLKTAA